MKLLEYADLDTSKVKAAYKKVSTAICKGDFKAAQVKKMLGATHHKFYRAKLDESNRLLFSLWRYGDEICVLMLEVILNHNYSKSRFLFGCEIDESKIIDADFAEATQNLPNLRYIHPKRMALQWLDKPISFDDAQHLVYQQNPPLILVGSAGSGKTALTLEKLKHANGEVLYVTHSPFLAQNARDLYYALGFEREGQEAQFLSFRELMESLHLPGGREVTWRDFSAWFARMKANFKGLEAHQAFEEIRGVILAHASGVLSRQEYRDLGVRQSIFSLNQRDILYDLFEKYRTWLSETKLFDLNLLAHPWRQYASARYDFIVIDEVQDLTAAQLSLVLANLKHQGQFLLCGDSNQIVHPNFFSWTAIKSLFWHNDALANAQHAQQLFVLSTNYRNGTEATRIANTLLKIKHKRFGSIDRESNFLVESIGGEVGQVALMSDVDQVRRDFDQKIRHSTQFAVLVMRDEDKAEARKIFATPLLFSIHEAKGLEYDNIVLYRFISNNRKEFADISEGVNRADLEEHSLDYKRAKSKEDKSLEVYKFFVNALYVALTRAIKNVFLIESDLRHPLFDLFGLQESGNVKVEANKASLEDWQKEARKLELQGKQEQADAIRSTILKQVAPPWPVFDEEKTRELLRKTFRDAIPGNKHKHQLFDIATCQDLPVLASDLRDHAGFDGGDFSKQRTINGRKTYLPYFQPRFKEILTQCDKFGVDHRLPMNQTPLMAAAASGNVSLVEALLEKGANKESVDHFGSNALHWALRMAFDQADFAKKNMGALYELLAPSHLDVNTGERLVRIDKHLSEYFLLQTMWTNFRHCFTRPRSAELNAAFNCDAILAAWEYLPANMVRPERNRRAYISSVLARNEITRDYQYNRALFRRLRNGWYQFNPALSVRNAADDEWKNIFQALNLPLLNEFSIDYLASKIGTYCEWAQIPQPALKISIEKKQSVQSVVLPQQRNRQRPEVAKQQAELVKALSRMSQPQKSNQGIRISSDPYAQQQQELLAKIRALKAKSQFGDAMGLVPSDFWQTAGESELVAVIAREIGIIAFLRNEDKKAREILYKAIDIFEALGMRKDSFDCLTMVGICNQEFRRGASFSQAYRALSLRADLHFLKQRQEYLAMGKTMYHEERFA